MFYERGRRGELCTLRLLVEPNVNTNGRSSAVTAVGGERSGLLGDCLHWQIVPLPQSTSVTLPPHFNRVGNTRWSPFRKDSLHCPQRWLKSPKGEGMFLMPHSSCHWRPWATSSLPSWGGLVFPLSKRKRTVTTGGTPRTSHSYPRSCVFDLPANASVWNELVVEERVGKEGGLLP